MRLTGAIQEALLSILCYAPESGLVAHIRTLVPAKSYDAYYRDIAQVVFDYYDRYHKAPGEHTLDLIEALQSRNPNDAELFGKIFDSLDCTKSDINKDYVLEQASLFARHQRLKYGITRAIDLMKSDGDAGILEAEGALARALKGSTDLFRPGILLSDPKESLAFLDREQHAFRTGIKELDEVALGPDRKRLHVFVGLPGRGKSWWLVHLGKMAIRNRLVVVHVTLELSEDEVSQRYMQALFSIGKRDVLHERQTFEQDELGRYVGFSTKDIEGRPALAKPGKVRKFLTPRVRKLANKPPLIIREFPTGALTVTELNAYLDGLEESRGIIPDLVIIDYADLMKIAGADYRVGLGTLYKELRGIAVRRNVAIATASQANKGGMSARTITERNIAEDFSKVATADVVITYNQTQSEKELGFARLFVAKGRTDRDKFTILLSQNYALGQFCFESTSIVSTYWDDVNNADKDGDGGDD